LVLIAVVSTPNLQIAILQRAEGGEPARVKIGETLEGWTLLAVHPDHVELGSGGVENTLYLLDSIPKQAIAGN
jgi:type II secretory pathway component PulC